MATERLPYLHRRGDTSGWFFIRRVPSDLREAVGLTTWRWLLAHDLATARRLLPEAVAKTDELIEQLRGSHTAAPLPALRAPIPRALDRRLLRGRPDLIRELVSVGAPIPDDAIELAELPREEVATHPVSPGDLLELAERLKTNSSEQTRIAWRQALEKLTGFLRHDQLHLVTRDDAAAFRDNMLTSLKVSTTKTRLNYLSGLFTLAVEEQLLPTNPFTGVGKRLTAEHKQDKAVDVVEADKLFTKLSPQHQVIYQMLRWSGMRLAECLGLKLSDIDLDAGVIHVRPHIDRPLKTKDSLRDVPVHPNLTLVLKGLIDQGQERPFGNHFNETTKRWGSGISWTKVVGLNPHALRHNAVSSMRAGGIQEVVIGRVVGHSVPGMTAQYGRVSKELLEDAVRAIQ